jgi:hypothetical protein
MEQQEDIYKSRYKELNLLGRGNYGTRLCYFKEVLIRSRVLSMDSFM